MIRCFCRSCEFHKHGKMSPCRLKALSCSWEQALFSERLLHNFYFVRVSNIRHQSSSLLSLRLLLQWDYFTHWKSLSSSSSLCHSLLFITSSAFLLTLHLTISIPPEPSSAHTLSTPRRPSWSSSALEAPPPWGSPAVRAPVSERGQGTMTTCPTLNTEQQNNKAGKVWMIRVSGEGEHYQEDISDSLSCPQVWIHLDVSFNNVSRLGDQRGQNTRQDAAAEVSQGGWRRRADF